MVNEALYQYVCDLVGSENVLRDEPMSAHTTFRVGGEAECMVKVPDKDTMVQLVKRFYQLEVPYYVLGNGSNVLVGDKGIQGFVLNTSAKMKQIEVDGEYITVESGELLSKVASVAQEHALTGLEFASGIPGTIGGALVMNAGAYDGEMSQVVQKVIVVSKEGEVMELDNDTMEFGYRTSIIKNRPFIVLGAVLKLATGNRDDIRKKMEDFAARRREKQPLEYPSAGSTFKRPEGYYAGKLIMDAGLRGLRVGGAQVSEKHCGFIINIGNATATDISDLIDEVTERVKDKFNIPLETEIIRLGEF
jgi:UDP-N-acetylmuramate dehydrogenase